MTHWLVTYHLSCGCHVRVRTTDKGKRVPGQAWECPDHGEQQIVREEGHGV